MPWSLEIHHINLNSSGDSTLIIARHPAVGANPAIARAVLIDAGQLGGGGYVDGYINANAPAIQLHAIVATHFDNDHYYGIINLLKRPITARYHNAILYDCGRLPNDRLTDWYNNPAGVWVQKVSKYQDYLNRIAARPGMRHATATVNSFHIVQYDANNFPTLPTAAVVPAVAGFLPPTWLLGKDVMWGNGLSGPPGPAAWAETPPVWAPNHPTLRCIVANKWVQQVAGPPRFISEVDIYNGPARMTNAAIATYESAKEQDNAKSLGFLLEFNQFRYYIAGDLERAQEDGLDTLHTAPPQPNPGVRAFINQTNNSTGRLLAMKTSHHGAATSSSRNFLSALRPSVAIISNSRKNRYGHPFRETINSLDGYPEYPIGANAANRHPLQPPPPPFPAVRHYLTGYQKITVPVASNAGTEGHTAGPPSGPVRLTVSEAQSLRDRKGQTFRGVRAAAAQIAASTGLVLTAAQLDAIADAAVMHGAIAACAVAAGTTVQVASAATLALTQAGDGINAAGAAVPGVVSAAVAAAGGGQAAATAAAAAIGPGTAAAISPGTAEAIGATVTGAGVVNINAAALAAVPPPTGPAANAAAVAAVNVRPNTNVTAAGFAVVAALSAAIAGATAVQAAALASATGLLIGGRQAHAVALLTANVAVTGGMAAGRAALAGAAVGAAAFNGTPAAVGTATSGALQGTGIAQAAADAAGNLAQAAATIAATDLFNVHYTAAGVAQNIPHSG